MSNSHFKQANLTVDYYRDKNVGFDSDVIALGQLEATLAVAYEQHTANLIAMQQVITPLRDGRPSPELHAQIMERLGLNVEVDV